ncbi:MAG: HAD family phosphatase [Planctomycetota bacterium]
MTGKPDMNVSPAMVQPTNQTTTAIRLVLFDLGNVLVAFDRDRAANNVANLFDASVDEVETLLHGVRDLTRDPSAVFGIQASMESGELSEAAFCQTIRETLSKPDSPKSVSDQAILTAISAMFWPIEGMSRVVQDVRDLGLAVGILSNTCRAHWDWIQAQEYEVTSGRFDCTILSYKVGAMKPSPAIYSQAERGAADLGVRSGQILFLDDRQENVDAATERGWYACCCTGVEAAVSSLHEHGIATGNASRTITPEPGGNDG